MKRILNLLFLVFFSAHAVAETVKDREGAVRADKASMEGNARWIYNDVDAGFAAARETGKPLVVVLRCVPCMACMGIDTEVLTENEKLTPLLDQFVRVRLINANAIDLSLFQFDWDLSFSVLFFNADKTIYGRFGSWEHQHDSQNHATETFRQALEGALELHKQYPDNRKALTAKKGDPMRFKTPVDMPLMKERDLAAELDWSGQVVKSCVHCHQVGDAIRFDYRDSNQPMPLKWIFPYPRPESIGVTFEADPVTRIATVSEDSIAAKTGLKSGDRILELEGQPLISTADVSWVLHHAPESGSILAQVERGGEVQYLSLELPDGWRSQYDGGKRVGVWPMRMMAFGGMCLVEMSAEERKEKGISPGKMALFAEHVGQYGKHALAKKQGFLKDDILVEVDGQDGELTERQLIARLLLDYEKGAHVPAVVLRAGRRIELRIVTQ